MPSLGEELTLAYLLLSSFTYGFHISSLNAPRSALTCSPHAAPSSSSSLFSLPLCLSISSSEFGYVTAAYTLGGLLILPFLPSLLAKSPDVRRTLRVCAATAAVGSLVQAGSTGVGSLVLGRLLSGIGAAAGISEVPGGLVRVVQASSGTGSRRSVGIFHQLSICTGIFSALALGLFLSKPFIWRYILLIASFISLSQLILSFLVLSPEDFPSPSRPSSSSSTSPSRSATASRACTPVTESDPLLDSGGDSVSVALRKDVEEQTVMDGSESQAVGETMSYREVLSDPSLRKGVVITLFAMLLQQFSGINAIMYFSTSILTPLMPSSAPLISVLVSLVSLLSTLPAILLLPILGKKTLLLTSIFGIAVSTVAVGWGLDAGLGPVAAGGVFSFVAFFGLGLGPIPFILTSDLVTPQARSSLSSLALLVNFSANLLVGACFLPLRTILSSPPTRPWGSREGTGRVFYVFTACLVVGWVGIWKGLRR